MVEINRKQYCMLKRIKHCNSLNTQQLNAQELEICDFLESHNFIVAVSSHLEKIGGLSGYANIVAETYAITQAGRAQIYAFASKFRKWWVSVVISVVSLIISAVAIVF